MLLVWKERACVEVAIALAQKPVRHKPFAFLASSGSATGSFCFAALPDDMVLRLAAYEDEFDESLDAGLATKANSTWREALYLLIRPLPHQAR